MESWRAILSRTNLPQQFDAYVWFDETRAVTPLDTGRAFDLNHPGCPDPRLDRISIARVVFSCPNWLCPLHTGRLYAPAGMGR
jgi:hypothetical protein